MKYDLKKEAFLEFSATNQKILLKTRHNKNFKNIFKKMEIKIRMIFFLITDIIKI